MQRVAGEIMYGAGMSKIRPGGQNQSAKGSNLALWTALKNMKQAIIFFCLLTVFFTAFPAKKKKKTSPTVIHTTASG